MGRSARGGSGAGSDAAVGDGEGADDGNGNDEEACCGAVADDDCSDAVARPANVVNTTTIAVTMSKWNSGIANGLF